jgi:hypothetical protein
MTLCKDCFDTGCCRACGGRGSKPCLGPRGSKRQCRVCTGTGECNECRSYDPVDPVYLYARALLQTAGGAQLQYR